MAKLEAEVRRQRLKRERAELESALERNRAEGEKLAAAVLRLKEAQSRSVYDTARAALAKIVGVTL